MSNKKPYFIIITTLIYVILSSYLLVIAIPKDLKGSNRHADGYSSIDTFITIAGYSLTAFILTILNFKFGKITLSKNHFKLFPILILIITYILFLMLKIIL